MSVRSDQKTRLEAILETITFNSVALPVFSGVKTSHTRYPYVFITSGGLTPNKDGGTLRDRGTYERVREYAVTLVFQQNSESISEINDIEVEIDELEELVLNKLGDESTRNDAQYWVDLYVTDVSAPLNGAELALDSSFIVKTFTVAIETQEAYD